jgi:hypothetical protein
MPIWGRGLPVAVSDWQRAGGSSSSSSSAFLLLTAACCLLLLLAAAAAAFAAKSFNTPHTYNQSPTEPYTHTTTTNPQQQQVAQQAAPAQGPAEKYGVFRLSYDVANVRPALVSLSLCVVCWMLCFAAALPHSLPHTLNVQHNKNTKHAHVLHRRTPR